VTELLGRLATEIGGRYQIERELGRGGMATVYLARDVANERDVAIKVMDPELAQAIGADRFRREIDVAGKLQHPNILGILDSGEASGTSYYVMPYVTGETLRHRLEREQQLPIEEALRIAREVADALDYAHKQGVIHRDIKPENILLEDGHAMVADFGIARAADAGDGKSLTKTGMALGTPHYMSPEQIFGEKHIDGRTDQYALACMLHEMLAGQPPFVGPNAQSLMSQHAMDEPPLVTRFRPTVPPNVEDAILTGLAKARADRFPTLSDFHSALENTGYTSMMKATRLANRATTQGLQAMQKPVPLWRKLLPIAATVVLVAGGAGLWFGVLNKGPASLSVEERALMRKVAVLYFTPQGGADPTLADGLSEALIDRLRQVSALNVISRNGVAPFKGSSAEPDSVGRALGVGTVVQGTVRNVGDKVRVDFTLFDAQSGSPIKDANIELAANDVAGGRDALADAVARELQELLGQDVALKEARAATSSTEAWTMYQRAQRSLATSDSLFRAGKVPESESALAAADSLALRSASLDAKWADPVVLRGRVAHRRALRLQREPAAASPWVDSALVLADRALTLNADSPDAYELRGSARYDRTRLGLVPDRVQREEAIASAEQDLLKATSLEPTLATAFNTLSMMQYQKYDVAASANFARKAYEADAYLTAAPAILFRLYVTNYDMAQATAAKQYCDEGANRFPNDARFVRCRLWLMTMRGIESRPDSAWKLLEDLKRVTPPQDWEYARRDGEIAIAGALARANPPLADSARRVLDRAKATPDIDPRGELVGLEAFVRVLLGENDQAIRMLEQFLTQHPEHVDGFKRANAWWWAPIASDPRFQRITSLGS
jgi:TolB-like protein/tRNA A-37 threonylcarbamoyl transferase component Bud32